MTKPVIAITTGEPAGIGPEISIRGAACCHEMAIPVLIGDYTGLKQLASKMDVGIELLKLDMTKWNPDILSERERSIGVIDSPLLVPAIPGHLDARNGKPVLSFMDIAINGAQTGKFDAVVTAPVQKSTINDAGIPFTGHTEYFAEKTGTKRVVMMLAGLVEKNSLQNNYMLRVALATTHLPLKEVSQSITEESLLETASIVNHELQTRFGIESPHILMTGLNPHAGENGYLGDEEIRVINPAIRKLRSRNINVSGPFPADTLFQPHYLEHADCVIAMYHDQGLPVLKYATFGHGVNITLGLPIIRTSVDHGTALDIASKGLGLASHGSMIEAIRIAAEMALSSKKHKWIVE